ncbi:membrane glycosyltransferase [Rubritalea squalenifaciens DSM 18772]|uniref:Glucans biosynthesis glucosyltransferase H n=1 Tax=Rubritalea squalenifaciens DSM 18772 TaxID=1123071 RepID=A0A1M6QCR0_9BACT|nr:glucans biosynthesis glucosyltransferase MdoH [Rubritalea squalenifaciens]SHK17853.1 membrane glycosyltransferase [Rubritalea squalenifaciens DSM 18772]
MSNESSGQGRVQPSSVNFWPTFTFFSIVVVISSVGSYLMADYLWRLGWTFSSTLLWILFTTLFAYLSFGFTHAAVGFTLRRMKSKFTWMPSAIRDSDDEIEIRDTTRAAIIIPIYNEPVERVFSGIRAIFDSVNKEEHGERFDFFILSDSNKPEQWVAEEAAWVKLCRECKAQERIFYRRRSNNAGKKSGNVADFCRTWGTRYRYMVVLDADSIMTGKCLVEMLKRMESNPQVGIIQTVPSLVNGESLYGRMQQFAHQLYAPVFMEGLAFWQSNGGNCWGHNTIIRLRPFMEYCDLPELPGRKPFGGHILSHDFVEAGLMRRAGWDVWLAHDLDGSYEEGPQGIVESAQRDQRWCQGNMQHGMLLLAKGLRGKTRVHLANGILCYLSSLLWLLFMMVSFWRVYDAGINSMYIPAANPAGIMLLGITLFLLFTPKLLCLFDLAFDNERKDGFGGWFNACTSTIMETLMSALIAPIMMMFFSRFVIGNIIGKTVGWSAQRRGAQGTNWYEALSAHGLQSLIGILAGLAAGFTSPVLFWWLFPVLLGLWLSIPISVLTSRLELGMEAKREGLFMVPTEFSPPKELTDTLNYTASEEKKFRWITAAVLDPFLNAVHISLLRKNHYRMQRGSKVYGSLPDAPKDDLEITAKRKLLANRLLLEGPASLDTAETLEVLSDIDSMLWLHRESWLRPDARLGPWWRRSIREVSAAI